MPKFIFCAALLAAVFARFATAETKPKYGPEAHVISISHDYFKHASAPDFWALIPYYTAQQDDSSCSVASITMLVNAARAGAKLTSEDELATQEGLIQKVKHPAWHKTVLKNNSTTLDELGEVVRQSLESYGVKPKSVEVVHEENTPAALSSLRALLLENEKSSRDFLVINFNQQVFTGDADVGHIAPVGAYDAKKKQVLVLDPDRKWYEPYWVSDETLLRGMATQDSVSGKSRGYVYIKL